MSYQTVIFVYLIRVEHMYVKNLVSILLSIDKEGSTVLSIVSFVELVSSVDGISILLI